MTHIEEESKKSYYRDILSDNMHNSSQIWRTVNDIVRYKSKQKHNLPSFFIDEHNIILKDPVKISNSFNNYFANVGSLLATKITSSNNRTVFQYPSAAQIPASFFLKPILEEEVIKQLRNLKASKSPGAYHIPNKIIKLSIVIIAPILTKLFNDSIRQGVFPDVLKIAQVVPFHKSGSKHKFSNYRPISILSSFSKIFEKCLHNQISSYLTKKKILSPQQYGFRPNYSTSIALNDICNELLHNLKENKISCTVFLDLAKAFDTVDHTILIKKLKQYGIRGTPLELLKNYLQNRN